MNLKRNLLRKKILKLNKDRKTLNSVKRIELGLVFEGVPSEEISELLKKIKDKGWEENRMKIIICDLEEALPRKVETEVLNLEDIGFNGKIKEELRLKFLEYDYEFLIGCFSEKSLTAGLVFALSGAGIKIGRKPDVFNLFDVEISANESKVFFEESLKYLKILKAKS